jgi:glycosyltransferase involved in cell wall biosynthesis
VFCLLGRASPGVTAYSQSHPWVRLAGYQPHAQVLNFVSAFDIGVYPRSGDALGAASIKLLEYMACGVPSVGLGVGEMEVVRDSGAGVVVQDWAGFVAQVVRLVGDAALRRELGQRGKEYVQRFNWERLAVNYEALLDRMTDAAGRIPRRP